MELKKKIKENYHELIDLKKLIEDFKDMFSEDKLSLEKWLIKAKAFNILELDSFINGIKRDIDAVENSFNSIYSNGLLEGMVNKVKEIKRMSYGRCKFDLFRIKILNHQEIFG
ncbi:transposase [Schnuerera sp.]|uniref:transposase n=1 Tax=Schnuerera sp. TaxID=2794844 RepID=UPI002BB9156A|nr:transposase [Schnuerera sp.]HSH36460.1 transposase [Schnuerera sp.]